MEPHDVYSDYLGIDTSDASTAAVGVAVMIAVCVAGLVLMRKSGFRAMVAVGR